VQNEDSNFIYGEITTLGSLKVLSLLRKLSASTITTLASSSPVPAGANGGATQGGVVQSDDGLVPSDSGEGGREIIYDLGSGEGLFCILAGP
jgi:hypothetical protein